MSFAKRHWRAILFVAIATIGVASLGSFYALASQLAHPPRRALQPYHQEFLHHPDQHGLRIDSFTASDGTPVLVCSPDPDHPPGKRGKALRAQFAAEGVEIPAAGKCVGNLVLLHGRKGRKEDFLPIAERLCAVGFRCILPDLPGHGDNPTKDVTFGIQEAAIPQLVLAESAERYQFDEEPVGLLGMSMGGSVAVHAAVLHDAPWRTLVIISSFDALAPTVEKQVAHRLGNSIGKLCLQGVAPIYEFQTGVPLDSIQPAALAANLHLPTLIAHGAADNVIPIDSGRRLFDSLPESPEKTWIEIPDAGHDNVLITDFPIYHAIARWMLNRVPFKQ
ncbi:alpha/beta fold hydrolase [Luteolibacter pohnpeiensis]|uniref:Alpha/beta fold hydrolase n=2 Tax=Luteolibacter pohnpeiensis TaxID=454153 RepID=A0A934S348_9BACT|nr:alpha/beta fold hydrolase [Luteolibacter pohnpeiensis]